MRRPSVLAATSLLVLLALAACGGGSAGIPEKSLSALVLKTSDLPRFEQFDAGAQVRLDNSAGARQDPQRFGREGGWKARYRRGGGPSTSGPLVVESRADLFDSQGGATKDLAAYRHDFDAAVAAAPETVRELAAPDVGDDAIALTSLMPGLHSTRFFRIAWRYRNATASVLIQGFAGRVQLADALRLARRQQALIAASTG
jgi:hypothetical protein